MDRYWVGGTASWDATAGTKWALTDGGAGGQAVPTSADDVFFTALSGAVTVTAASAQSCLALNFTGFTGTFTGTATLSVSGSITLSAGLVWSYTGNLVGTSPVSPVATNTLTSAGKTLANFNVNANSGSSWQLGDALALSGVLTVTAATFTTNNFNVTASSLSSSNSNVRTINLGSSTVTLSGANAITLTTASNLTFNAGTSSIILTGATSRIFGNTIPGIAVTFNNVSFTSTALTNGFIDGINNSNIFNNLQVSGPAAAGVSIFNVGIGFTVNGTLSTTGTAGNRRVWFRGITYGVAQTLTINSAPSLTDADFRDIYVIGTAAPISGTRIGDLRGIRGITASTPKTVYWNLAAGGDWSANAWAATSGGAVSTNNFPLAQDTAVIGNTGLNTSATVTMDSAVPYVGTIDMSTRTNAANLSNFGSVTCYGNITAGSGSGFTSANTFTLSGRTVQTITSAGKSFVWSFVVDSYGGTVQLADALNLGTTSLTVTNGTFDTKNYNVTAGSLSSSNSNVRTINLGSSTVTLSAAFNFTTATNFTFNAGTSTVTSTSAAVSMNAGGLTFYNLTFTDTTASTFTLAGTATYNNLTFSAPASAGIRTVSVAANQTINGTLTVAGATAVRRIFVRSDTLGTTRTLTVNSLSAQDCDFRDITIAGAAAGSSPVRAGDCGGNTGITFPAAKTVYWNLAGTQNWSAIGWASSSGGTPDINQFPLAQDTAVFDNTGAITQINTGVAFNFGTIDFSNRTSAVTFSFNAAGIVYGNFKLGTGVTVASNTTTAITFAGRGTQTITSNGVSILNGVTVDSVIGTVQLADALIISQFSTLLLTSGTFDAVTYNVTTGLFNNTSATTATVLKMGSGTWTLSGTGTVWNTNTLTFYKGTANIVLSNTSTTARTFSAGTASYNKLTIGGTTGTSTTTINGNGAQFTELASTKTVAHTIELPSGLSIIFGAWTVTGTAGNVVTVTGTSTITIAGAAVSGVDYLALGANTVSATSPGEFYAGANSTATSPAAPLYLTAKPADSTRYWVGGTGNWSDTARWSTSSGGAGGASVPRSHDDVVFDSLSNATAYTATVNAVTGGIRTKALTIAGPLTGNVTLAGSTVINGIHGNVTLPATGLTRTYTGGITLSGSATGRTLTTNGVTLASATTINGVGCGWSLGSAFTITSNSLTVTNGSFNTANFSFTANSLLSSNSNTRSITLGSSTLSFSGTSDFISFNNNLNLSFDAGTSLITANVINASLNGGSASPSGITFYDVSFIYTVGEVSGKQIRGTNTFRNLSISGMTSPEAAPFNIYANQTVTGTFTISAGTNATYRTFLRSDTLGTTRTLTCAAFSGTDVDFRDITIAGAAAPVSGTRLGDCKGNSGITFGAGVTRYWNLATGGFWTSNAWAATSGGTPNINNFPLAQDMALFEATGLNSGASVTINAVYNIGTIDMSARTSNTMTLATGSTTPTIYGNWINGTGTTLTGTGTMTFAGRGSQTITSAGKTFTQGFTINTPGGSVAFQDAFTVNVTSTFTHTAGTLNGNGYNVTLSNSSNAFSTAGTATRTLAIGSGTWTFAGIGATAFNASTSTNLTVTGTGTISLTAATAKTFQGGGLSYSGITLDQGGAGTLTITGNNTFKDISNSYKATGATNITLGTTTQRVSQFTAAGEVGRVLTVQGTSASSPATLIFTGSGQATTPTTDYLAITGVRAYDLTTTWYAGANSTNNGSLGWYFEAGGGGPIAVFITESSTAADTQSSAATLYSAASETTTASDAAAAGLIYIGTLNESATAADVVEAVRAFLAEIAEAATSADLISASLTFAAAVSELTAVADSTAVSSRVTLPSITETAQMADALLGGLLFLSNISETLNPADTAAALLVINRAIFESINASEAAQVVASTFSAAAADQAAAEDLASTQAVMNAYVNYLPQPMSALPLGTSAAGSVIFDGTSLVNGCSVVASGTGTGTGGFALGGNYLGFAEGIFGGPPRADGAPIDLTQVTHIRVSVIAGDTTNGGPYYNTNFSVYLTYFNGASYTTLGLATITPAAATTLISVTVEIPLVARVSFAYFGFSLGAKPSPYTTPVWGLQDVTLYYGGASGGDLASNTYRAEPTVLESAQIADSAFTNASIAVQIADSTTASDQSSVAPSNFSAVALAVAQAVDSQNAPGSVYNAAVPIQGAGITDSFIGAYLWNPIDDSQTPNWQNIPNPQGSGWVLIPTDDDPNWQPTLEP